jgi:hypothetical protein
MTHHLTPDEIIDAVEATLAPARTQHLAACDACRQRVVDLDGFIRDAKAVDVPDPSPLFWDHLSARVREAIADDPSATRRRVPEWLGWRALAPMTGLALVVLVLLSALPDGADPLRRTTPATVPGGVASADLPDPATAADEGWAVVEDLVGTLDLETIQQAGIATTPGSAERAVLELTDAEQQELVRLLQLELKGSGG